MLTDVNPLTPISDKHVTSPGNFHSLSLGQENTLTYHVEVVILI